MSARPEPRLIHVVRTLTPDQHVAIACVLAGVAIVVMAFAGWLN